MLVSKLLAIFQRKRTRQLQVSPSPCASPTTAVTWAASTYPDTTSLEFEHCLAPSRPTTRVQYSPSMAAVVYPPKLDYAKHRAMRAYLSAYGDGRRETIGEVTKTKECVGVSLDKREDMWSVEPLGQRKEHSKEVQGNKHCFDLIAIDTRPRTHSSAASNRDGDGYVHSDSDAQVLSDTSLNFKAPHCPASRANSTSSSKSRRSRLLGFLAHHSLLQCNTRNKAGR